MTIGELIKELEKIDNQSKIVYFDDEEWGTREVNEISNKLTDDYIILKSHY